MRLNKKTLTLVGDYLAFQIGSGVREENRNQFSKEECLWIKRE